MKETENSENITEQTEYIDEGEKNEELSDSESEGTPTPSNGLMLSDSFYMYLVIGLIVIGYLVQFL